ncbi:MAG: hypothetical protein GWP03_06150 [Proteobacteria bacterium]|nr:hypothetical protein [Pseudomonadota bacterium]
MNHDYYKILIEKKIGGMISDSELLELSEHLKSCEECKHDLEEAEKMNKLLSGYKYKSPEDRLWENYKSNIYTRIERGIGWIFFSIGAIILLIASAFYFIKDFLLDNSVPIIIRIGVSLLIVGLVILLVSIIRERIFFNKNERYKEVKK